MKEKMKRLGALLFLVIYFPIVFIILNVILPVFFIVITPFDNLQVIIRLRKLTNGQKASKWCGYYIDMNKVILKMEESLVGKYSLFTMCCKLDGKVDHKMYLHYLKKAAANA